MMGEKAEKEVRKMSSWYDDKVIFAFVEPVQGKAYNKFRNNSYRKGLITVELLLKDNIEINCKEKPKEQVIRHIGRKLYESGYVEESYIEAMLLREESFSTNIGNGIALPHGIEAAKENIKKSGIAVMVFPEGTDWGSEKVKIVIAVAGSGEEHLEILSNIADKLSDIENVIEVVNSDADRIYEILTGK